MFTRQFNLVKVTTILLLFCCLHGDSQKTNVILKNMNYTFYKVKVSYDLASVFCKATNSSLANIKTREIQALINQHLWFTQDFYNNHVGYWTGGRMDRNDVWVWSDGSPIPIHNSTAFDYSQQNAFMNPQAGDRPRKCLAVRPHDYTNFRIDNTGKWQLDSCGIYNYFICQRDIKSNSASSFESNFSCDCDNSFMFGIIVFLVVLASLLIFVVIILVKKSRQMQHQLQLSKPQYDHQQNSKGVKKHFFSKADSKTAPHQTDLPHNRGIISDAGYEVVTSEIPSRPKHMNQPTYELAERLRGESGLYMEIPDDQANEKKRENNDVWKGPYLDMKGSKDSSALANTLPPF